MVEKILLFCPRPRPNTLRRATKAIATGHCHGALEMLLPGCPSKQACQALPGEGVAERIRRPDSFSGVSVQQSVGSSPCCDTYVSHWDLHSVMSHSQDPAMMVKNSQDPAMMVKNSQDPAMMVKNHHCWVLRMGHKTVGPVFWVMLVKEPSKLITKRGFNSLAQGSRIIRSEKTPL